MLLNIPDPKSHSCAGSLLRFHKVEKLESASSSICFSPCCCLTSVQTTKYINSSLFLFHSVFRVDFSFKTRNTKMKMGSAFISTQSFLSL